MSQGDMLGCGIAPVGMACRIVAKILASIGVGYVISLDRLAAATTCTPDFMS